MGQGGLGPVNRDTQGAAFMQQYYNAYGMANGAAAVGGGSNGLLSDLAGGPHPHPHLHQRGLAVRPGDKGHSDSEVGLGVGLGVGGGVYLPGSFTHPVPDMLALPRGTRTALPRCRPCLPVARPSRRGPTCCAALSSPLLFAQVVMDPKKARRRARLALQRAQLKAEQAKATEGLAACLPMMAALQVQSPTGFGHRADGEGGARALAGGVSAVKGGGGGER
jgi:hypothetical protein